MTAAGAGLHRVAAEEQAFSLRRVLLGCGIVGATVYPLADIYASTQYPGFSYRDMAVSELFAIGAPTEGLVVPLFTASSTLLLMFAIGIWMSADGRRLLRAMAVTMALNTIDALVLWNFFPMHMRGEPQTITDTMHGALAIDPFVLATLILAAIAFPGGFRRYTVATIAVTTALAISAVWFVAAFLAQQPTPWMGATERAGQYLTNLWYAVLAATLLRAPTRGKAA